VRRASTTRGLVVTQPRLSFRSREVWREWLQLGWPGILLLGLWANYNSGPWHLTRPPSSPLAVFHAARAALALIVPLLAACVYGRRAGVLRQWTPAHLWMLYAAMALLGGMLSGHRQFSVVYWASAYAGAFLASSACIHEGNEIVDAASINRVTWFVVTVVIVALVIVARDVLVVGEGLAASGYTVLRRMPQVGGMVMSRSTGLARFAAVPGLVALGMALHRKGVWRMVGLAAYLVVAVFLYIMQSRGATAGFIGGTFFMLICSGRGGRAVMVLLIIGLAGAVALNAIPPEIIDHLSRGQSLDQLQTTGRTLAWSDAWVVMSDNPVIGYGFEADRWLIRDHVHNTYMYALVAGGLPGLGLFVAGLVWAWVLFVRSLRHPALAASGQKMTLVQVGGVLAFFTLRSIPEVCGSNYAVDYLVMLPAILYVHVLWRHLNAARAGLPRPL